MRLFLLIERRLRICLLVGAAALACAVARLPAPAGAAPVLAAAGDIACPPGWPTTPFACGQAATAAEIEHARPHTVAALGDDQYEQGGLGEFLGPGAFNDTWGAFKRLMRPVPGNHEYMFSPTASGYFEYFGSAAGPGTRGYYTYRVGRWQVFALNSACSDAGCGDSEAGRTSTAQLRWLKGELAHTHKRCILAYWHHPLFSSTLLDNEWGVAPLWRLLYHAGADVILNGHAHDYERFARLDPNGRPTSRGIREFVVGTGGEDHLPFSRTLRSSENRDDHDFGVLFLTLHNDRYGWQFRTAGGTVVDHGAARCHSA
jgi:acid phosphatase type 7